MSSRFTSPRCTKCHRIAGVDLDADPRLSFCCQSPVYESTAYDDEIGAQPHPDDHVEFHIYDTSARMYPTSKDQQPIATIRCRVATMGVTLKKITDRLRGNG